MNGAGVPTNQAGRLLASLLAAVLVALVVTPTAQAGQGVWITVHDRTPANVNLLSREGSNCWEGEDLNHEPSQSFVAPGKEVTYRSEKKTGRGCGGDAHQNAQFMVQDPGGPWLVPQGLPPGYHLFWQDGSGDNYGINLYNGLSTWVPREDGKGLICFHGEIKDSNHADVYAYSDRHCNEAVPETIQRSSPKPAPPSARQSAVPSLERLSAQAAATAQLSAEESEKEKKEKEEQKEAAEYQGVVNVLSAVGVACNWYVYPKEPKRCAEIDPGNAEKWSIGNVDREVRSFRFKSSVAAERKALVASVETLIPSGASPGQLSVNESVGMSESTGSTTQKGGKIGSKLGFKQSVKANLPFVGEAGIELSQEINAETNWSLTEQTTRTQSTTKSVQISAGAQPGFRTQLEVFTSKRDANYIYEADLEFGNREGKPQNVTTPANLALGQSPARRQPCLGYVVGDDSVRNSLVNIGRSLLRAGYRPDDSSLTEAQRAFLGGVESFSNGPKPCAGFPAGYSSSAGFKGVGAGTYANYGYDLNGSPVSKMVGCVYVKPYKQQDGPPTARTRRLAVESTQRLARLERVTATASPCQEVSIKGGFIGATPGVLVEDSGLGGTRAKPGFAGPTATGTAGSDRIVGPRRGGTVRTGGGAFDSVETGAGNTRVYATARENVVQAKGGSDLLVGGHGMNYLYGGGGNDRLVESDGSAEMFGEGGADSFEGHNMKGAMFGGGGNDRMVGTGNLSQLAMSGGAGSNVYVVKGHGTPQIVQLPGPGRSQLLTVHSLTVPANVTVAKAIGPARVTLRGGEARELVAGRGGATLIAGPQPARLRGGPGADTIVFNAMNDDVASGGGGGDRFVFSGSPETGQRPAGLAAPAHPSAPAITDFTPVQGDRLVMRASVFGSQVLALRHRFTVVVGPDPRPRQPVPTLLLDTRTGLVSFDRDGSGPISDQVVVTLPGARALQPGWFVFQRG